MTVISVTVSLTNSLEPSSSCQHDHRSQIRKLYRFQPQENWCLQAYFNWTLSIFLLILTEVPWRKLPKNRTFWDLARYLTYETYNLLISASLPKPVAFVRAQWPEGITHYEIVQYDPSVEFPRIIYAYNCRNILQLIISPMLTCWKIGSPNLDLRCPERCPVNTKVAQHSTT